MDIRKKLLLIDDDSAVLSYLAASLQSRYDIVTTTDARQAVGMAKAERPDLVLCDIDMPRMAGGEVAAAMAADSATANLPIVYLTSLVSPQETKDLNGVVGGRPGVSKRAPMAELVALIEASFTSS